MTREEIEQRMDKLASKYVEAHDRKSAGGGYDHGREVLSVC